MTLLFRFSCATILLLFSCFIESNAQSDKGETGLNKLTLRLAPLSLLENDGNVMVGLGYQWHRRSAVVVDAGYVFFDPYINSSSSGIKIRSDIRFLFDKSRPGVFSSFIGPEFHYKYVSSKKWDDFGINCLGGQCAYYQRARYKEVKKEIGGSMKIGTNIFFKSRWYLELYIGLGIKFIQFRDTDIPIGGSFTNPPEHNTIFNSNSDNAAQIIIPGGAKLVYRL